MQNIEGREQNGDLPLSGLRVLEFTHAVLGPTTGMILADLGAEVLKIEPAPQGDPTRKLRGFGMGYFPYLNRNKKSVVVNLKTAEGQEIVHKLLETADVLIENFGPGTMERLGLGYEQLKSDYASLIYCSLKGFMPGPYEQRTALDEVVQMMSGLAYMTGPPGQPLRAGASLIDMSTGMYGAMGVLLALQERQKHGRGQLVKSALFETAAFFMGHHMAYSVASEEAVPPMPARVSAWAIYHQFETADEQRVFVGVTSDKQWVRFCEVFGCEAWLTDERLATNNGRIEQRDWLLPELSQLFGRLTRAEILALCEAAQVSFAPITRPEDLFDDPQLNEGQSLFATTFPDGKQTKLPKLPLQMGDYKWALRHDPPQMGEHTAEILSELGYEEKHIANLQQREIVKQYREWERR
ncbi:MAG: CoA transferase [Anaerolineales bacterium]|nr:CoA transferase [Anaerolineales bacterium]